MFTCKGCTWLSLRTRASISQARRYRFCAALRRFSRYAPCARDIPADLLHGAAMKMPPQHGTFKQAGRVQQPVAEQAAFDLG